MKLKAVILSIAILGLFGCKKKSDCAMDKKCYEMPAKDELCDAAFQSWFYNKKDGKCYEKGYSGCEEYGFKTEEECLKCDCEDDKNYHED